MGGPLFLVGFGGSSRTVVATKSQGSPASQVMFTQLIIKTLARIK